MGWLFKDSGETVNIGDLGREMVGPGTGWETT